MPRRRKHPKRPSVVFGAAYFAQIPDVSDWLHRCYSLGVVHGSDLVIALGSPNHHKACGMCDNVAIADRILAVLEEEGWINRLKYTPTRKQLFFGVGGRPPGKRAHGDFGHPCEHCWETVRNRNLYRFLGVKYA